MFLHYGLIKVLRVKAYMCHRHWNWDTKEMQWLVCGGVRDTAWGHWWMCRWVSTTLLYMHKGFSHPKCRSRWQWCYLMMSLMSFLCILGLGIKGSMHKIKEVFTVHFPFGQFLVFWCVPWLVHPGSHRPSNSATSVHLKEWNYNLTGKCALCVQLYVLKFILGTLSWCALVVCKLVG